MENQDPTYLKKRLTDNATDQTKAMHNYYKLHALIYDSTRWTFLFGRIPLVRQLPIEKGDEKTILEVGCGTGYNLARMAKQYPRAKLWGLDVSTDMINKGQKKMAPYEDRVQWINDFYKPGDTSHLQQFDGIVFSYALTMINPQWKDLVEQAKKDLKPGGFIAVTDFHDSRFTWFKKHMANNHVKMESHILPYLEENFEPVIAKVQQAYFGVWAYFTFVGKVKKA